MGLRAGLDVMDKIRKPDRLARGKVAISTTLFQLQTTGIFCYYYTVSLTVVIAHTSLKYLILSYFQNLFF